MSENAHPNLLDRNESEKLAAQHYHAQIQLIDQLVNFGTNLIARIMLAGKTRTLGETIVTSVLLKQIVTMLDAISVLARAGISDAAFLQGRALFEASLHLQWMLFADIEKKALHYMVANLRDDAEWVRRGLAGTDENQFFIEQLGEFASDLECLDQIPQELLAAQQEQLAETLAQAPLAEVNKVFDEARGKKPYDPHWYTLCGAKSIRKIAEELQRTPEYDLFYTKAADVAHSNRYKDHIQLIENQFAIKSIRSLESLHQILLFTFSMTISTYHLVLQYFRPDEVKQFFVTYAAEWREAFLSMPKVNYEKTQR